MQEWRLRKKGKGKEGAIGSRFKEKEKGVKERQTDSEAALVMERQIQILRRQKNPALTYSYMYMNYCSGTCFNGSICHLNVNKSMALPTTSNTTSYLGHIFENWDKCQTWPDIPGVTASIAEEAVERSGPVQLENMSASRDTE